jgi:hypothetical protein
MRPFLPYLGALHAVLAILTLHVSLFPHGDAAFTLTLRRQFDGWHDLLALYRNTSSYAPLPPNGTRHAIPLLDALVFGEDMRDDVLRAAWCGEYLPPGTQRAPYCRCVSRQHDAYLNASSPSVAGAADIPASVRDAAVRGLVSCLRDRPVWRVWPFWSTHVASPCLYVLVVATAFLLVASDLDDCLVCGLVGLLCVYTSVALFASNPGRHCLWSFSILVVWPLVHCVIAPGLRSPSPSSSREDDPPGATEALLINAPGDRAQMPRGASCFWWAEYLSAPVFALYAGVVHCGRDFVYVMVVVVLGAAVGGLALRSFWCGQAYPDSGGKGQMRPILQRVVWLGILGASAGLLSLNLVYYQPALPLTLGVGSVAMLGATLLLSLLQYPGTETGSILPVQCALALARNAVMFLIVYADAPRMH